MISMVKDLCIKTGEAINDIGTECGINQTLVAKMFIATFSSIIIEVQKHENDPIYPLQ